MRRVCLDPGRLQSRSIGSGTSLIDPYGSSTVPEDVHYIRLEVTVDVDQPDSSQFRPIFGIKRRPITSSLCQVSLIAQLRGSCKHTKSCQ